MILVLGASGYTGLTVIRELVGRGEQVRAFIRDPAKTGSVLSAGASDVIVGDLRDLDLVGRAVRGVRGVFFIGPRFLPEEAELGKAVIDILVRAGVARFVYSGVYHPTIQMLHNHQAKMHIEDRLYKTGLEFTVLQPARFMHGPILSSRERILRDGVLADAFAVGVKMAYVDYRDVAEVAALAFTSQRLVNGVFELSAPGEFTLHEVASTIGNAIGRDLRAEQTPMSEYAPAAGLLNHPFSAEGFLRLRAYYNAYGFRGGNSVVLETILGRSPRDFGTCARDLLAVGADDVSRVS
ncbi:SDR family oxidoreductase [Nocardia pseudovaccinii]|uniref:SDR family oxidoreductase n=1 Tax=Nocardia pseudovaccinii TaxID=189540 RepID=UPI0007A501C0|nr:NmrA family NAD(P)-binding protein [Nocardia pseudovaccinii]